MFGLPLVAGVEEGSREAGLFLSGIGRVCDPEGFPATVELIAGWLRRPDCPKLGHHLRLDER